ncbi:LysR family transcriptional regulator [Fuscibacter oryzae]|uniref:LysR family transcriptional regulator n=1 Tax=Fuscibacter oryzae TaxID=2803939 RepID=A0A8J7MVE6_9RHOB|nr:LysR family transcriptional regulator [Fuscibacter oryzae]MBL4929785.1 LysR family transcriptional regulator [Fuscibacter oryzae]
MSLMNVHFRHIRAFVTIAQERSFVRAAVALGVSQPALSQTISQFEDFIGFPLFTRTTRNLALTEQGEALLQKALGLSREMDSFYAEIGTLQKSVRNQLRVGYMIGTAVEFIPALVREFKKLRPDAVLDWAEFDFSDPTAGLGSGKVDCAVVRPPLGIDDITLVELSSEPCVACLPAGHRLSGQASVVLGEILDEPFVAAPGQGIWRDYWIAAEHREGRPARIVYEAATVESELQAVAMDRGISITAESTARFYARPGVVFKPITDMPECSIAIGYRDGSSRLLKDFVTLARKLSQPLATKP